MIKIENLTKKYKLDNDKEVLALKDINLNVKEGEILGIIGISGSGKTSLLRVLRGIEQFDVGKVIIDDIEVNQDSSQFYFNKLKKTTAIHLQRSFGLWPETAINNVIRKLFGVKYGDEAMTDFNHAYDEFGDEAMDILKIVGLDEKSEHFAPVLSGGEKQRLIMARQLAKKPNVLLLDEPATMACPKTKQDVLNSIKRINKELNITVVLVSHLPEIHKFLADRLVFMEKGEIKEEGDVETVTNNFLKDLEPKVTIGSEVDDEIIIKVKDIKKGFHLLKGGNVLDIKDINFNVKKRDILTLLGPSGAGKTILLRMIGGLESPDDGEVLFKLDEDKWVNINEANINRMNVRRKIGFMHQEFALSHHATVRDQLAVRLGFKNQTIVDDAKKRAKELELSDELLDALYQLTDLPEIEAKARLEKIGLLPDILDELFPKFPEKAVKEEVKPIFDALNLSLDILNRKSYELSGGQKVRAMLALVLASKPEILLLDEPFGDLDPLTLRLVSNSIKKINKEFGTTIVMVSHNIDFIKELSKRAIFVENGMILDDGDPKKIAKDFINFCEADFLME